MVGGWPRKTSRHFVKKRLALGNNMLRSGRKGGVDGSRPRMVVKVRGGIVEASLQNV